MNFDLTITLGNLLTVVMFIGSIAMLAVKHRDSLAEIKSATASRCALLEQAHDFLRQQMNDDRARSDSHWAEVKNKLDKISDKLDQKADKPD